MKRFLFAVILVMLMVVNNIHAQNWVWGKSASGTGEDEGMSVSTDAAGNVYVTGGFDGPNITFGPTVLTNAGNSDVLLAKYDANGNVLWAKSAGGTGDEIANSICTDAFGDVFICGNFSGPTLTFGSTTLTNASGEDIFLVKYDANGNVLWAKSSTGTGTNEGYSVSADAGGNAFITGYFGGPTITFGSMTLSNAGSDDIFLVKYDPLGNVLWTKRAGGTSFDISNSVCLDATGNALITGRFFNSITFGSTILTSSGGADVFLAKYDASGNVIWAKSAGGPNNDMGFSVSSTPGGNISITGAFYSPAITFGTAVLSNSGLCNVFVTQYDIMGNVIWANSATGPDNYFGKSVSTDISGNIYAVGLADGNTSITFGTNILTLSSGIESYFIVKYDNAGNVLCDSILYGGVDDLAVSTDNNGNAYMAGDFGFAAGGTFIVGSDTLIPTGIESIFVAKYTCCTVPDVTAGTPGSICPGDSAALNASGAVTYSWSPATGLSCITCSNPMASPSTTTTYTVTGKINGCSDTAIITITVNPNPTINISGDVTIYAGENTTLNVSGGITFLWNNGETTSSLVASPVITTIYCVIVSDGNNCKDSICTTVDVKNPCDTAGTFFFPNAFSPNKDGENDLLQIYYNNKSCIKNLSLAIYDRWGEKIFETTDINFQWDGIYDGKIINTQVLAYQLYIQFTDDKEISRKGNISLVR